MSATDVPKMNLENHLVPVTDVDRAKGFYARLGWRLDDDVAPMDGLRFVQFTPPGSAASITFGLGLHTATPGSTQGTLVVSEIVAAHDGLLKLGIDVSEIWHAPPFPPRGAPTWPRPRAHQLRLILLVQRSRRQSVDRPRGDHAAPGPGVIGGVTEFLAKQRLWRVGHHAPDGKPSGLSPATYRLLINQRPTLPAAPQPRPRHAFVSSD